MTIALRFTQRARCSPRYHGWFTRISTDAKVLLDQISPYRGPAFGFR